MGIHKKGILNQKFKVTIDIEQLTEYIADKVIGAIKAESEFRNVEMDEYYLDDTDLYVDGSYETPFEYWHYDATLESPEENDFERASIGDGEWLLNGIHPEIQKMIKVSRVEEEDEDQWLE